MAVSLSLRVSLSVVVSQVSFLVFLCLIVSFILVVGPSLLYISCSLVCVVVFSWLVSSCSVFSLSVS